MRGMQGNSRGAYSCANALVTLDLTPDLAANEPFLNLGCEVSLCIDLKFRAAITNAMHVVVLAEFEGIVKCDCNHIIVSDFNC